MKRAACCRPRKRQPSTSTIDIDQLKKAGCTFQLVDVNGLPWRWQSTSTKLEICIFKFWSNEIFLFFKILSFWGTFGNKTWNQCVCQKYQHWPSTVDVNATDLFSVDVNHPALFYLVDGRHLSTPIDVSTSVYSPFHHAPYLYFFISLLSEPDVM